jgi:murein DD-endopeptidase MepM/ murein hydrolase activator NlpD
MADRTRLAAAGFFLALTLAIVPALLPVRFAGAAVTPPAEAIRPLVQLRGGSLAAPAESQPELLPEGVLQAAIAQTAPSSHSVAPGETLWKISSDAGITVETLASANHLLLGATLHPGQVLMIPSFDPAVARAPQGTHEVAAGETLWGISRASGVPVEALAAANHLPLEGVLHLGQRLVMPAPDRTAPWFFTPPARNGDHALFRRLGVQARPVFPSVAVEARLLEQPSEGLITSRFGWRTHPIFGTREFHTGLDIANHIGTPIRAAESGVVRFVGWMGGYGRLIVVAHANGLETSYSHLSSMLVALGQKVVRGDILGRMGNTGWSTGPHLLFEVRRNGVPIDPIPFLRERGGLLAQAADPVPSPVRQAAGPSVRPAGPPPPKSAAVSSKPAAASSKPAEVSPKPEAVSPPAGSTGPARPDEPAAAPPLSKEHRVVTDVVTETRPAPPATPSAPH